MAVLCIVYYTYKRNYNENNIKTYTKYISNNNS